MTDETLRIPGVYLRRATRVLHVHSERPLRVLSSAVAGADLAETRHILNLGVVKDYNSRAPAADLLGAAQVLGINEPFVGLMTATRLDRAQVVIEREGAPVVALVATVGVSKPIAAGVTGPFQRPAPGTINLILVVDANLAQAAAVNVLLTATEAKTLALVEGGLQAAHGGPASGTATDAVVLAWTGRGEPEEYGGPVTPVGARVARLVRAAIQGALD